MASPVTWKVHPEHFLANHRQTAATETLPEKPGTLLAQIKQLSTGKRRAVMIPRGTAMPIKFRAIPKHLRMIHVPRVGKFLFHPGKIGPKAIRHAVKHNGLTEILGATDGGMGAPDKSELQGQPEAVMAKDATGETVQGTLTDQGSMPETVEQTAKLVPEGGTLDITTPEDEIANRLAWAISPEDFLQQGAQA